MKTLQELQPLIIEWARERNIHLPDCAPKQRLKLIEECGELANAILKNDIEKQKDAIGDIFVVLVILSEQVNDKLDFIFCDDSDFIEGYYECISVIIECSSFDISRSMDYLNDVCIYLDLDLADCVNIAWNEIKDRKGTTVNGTFIKE